MMKPRCVELGSGDRCRLIAEMPYERISHHDPYGGREFFCRLPSEVTVEIDGKSSNLSIAEFESLLAAMQSFRQILGSFTERPYNTDPSYGTIPCPP